MKNSLQERWNKRNLIYNIDKFIIKCTISVHFILVILMGNKLICQAINLYQPSMIDIIL